MKRTLVLLLLASVTSVSQVKAQPVHNYMFNITGVVTSDDGKPVQDADVILEVDNPVYEGVGTVKTASRMTNETGGFVFAYISHKLGVKYTITVSKAGFNPQTLSGSAPPGSHHVIRLSKADRK